jgi:uncharacterized protein YycO
MTLKDKLIRLTGDLYLYHTPLFLTYKPQHHKVKGSQVREILNVIAPGDILLRRYNGYLNTLLTPGFWGHAALYIGDGFIIHAIGVGVVREDILDFCRCDSICVLRPEVDGKSKEAAINKAIALENALTEYDYAFVDDNGKVYCSEMIQECYGAFNEDYCEKFGQRVLTPQHIFDSKQIKIILVING